MSERDFPASGGESVYDAMQTVANLPESVRGSDGNYFLEVPSHKIEKVFRLCADGGLWDLILLPGEVLYGTLVNEGVPRLDEVRIKELPDGVALKYCDDPGNSWLYISFIYFYDFDEPNTERSGSVAVGVSLEDGKLTSGRQTMVYGVDEMIESLVPDIERPANASDVEFIKSVVGELARPD